MYSVNCMEMILMLSKWRGFLLLIFVLMLKNCNYCYFYYKIYDGLVLMVKGIVKFIWG